MKVSQVREWLQYYDLNKGKFRILVDEKHIRELRQFSDSLANRNDNDDLNEVELLNLAKICSGKRTWNGSQSSITLDELAKFLGGRDALIQLRRSALLNVSNLKLLMNSQYPNALSSLIVLLKGKYNEEFFEDFSKDANLVTIEPRLPYITSLVEELRTPSKTALMLVAQSKDSESMLDTVLLLTQHKFDESDWECLPLSEDIAQIYEVLNLLVDADRGLLPQYFKRICQLGNLNKFLLPILKELARSKDNITSTALDKLLSSVGVKSLEIQAKWIKVFDENGWDIQSNLPAIIFTIDLGNIKVLDASISILNRFRLNKDSAQAVFDVLFHNPEYYSILREMDYMYMLMPKTDANIIFRTPLSAEKMAKGIMILEKASIGNPKYKEILSTHHEEAESLAYLFKQLAQLGNLDEFHMEMVLKHPENASIAGGILKQLLANHISKIEDKCSLYESLYARNVLNLEFQDLLADLNKAKLLTVPNLNKILEHVGLFRTIASACCCLAQSEQLNQSNLELILEDPKRALIIAELLGGKPRIDNKEDLDEGAKDYGQVLRAARYLALGQRGYAFFGYPKKPKERQVQRFCELSHQDSSIFELQFQLEQQKALLIKIAAMCGNGYLEVESKEATATNVFQNMMI
nr:hypothetical protein [Legionella jordanis]